MITARRVALGATAAATVGIAASYAAAFAPGGAPAWAPWALAVSVSVAMTSLGVLGAARRDGRAGVVLIPLGITLVLLIACFGVALALPSGAGGSERIVLGLPLRAAVVLYGIGIVPAFILPLSYALTFDRHTLTEADIARVREAARAARKDAEAMDPE